MRAVFRSSELVSSAILLMGAIALAGCTPAGDASPEKTHHAATTEVTGPNELEVGRHLVLLGGCNDCHTPGYAQGGGQVPEAQWLVGGAVGFNGPWGTTYPHNLRLTVSGMSEDEWVEMLSTRTASPPMPWPSVRAMSDSEKRAVYRYIKTLGPVGEAAPVALAPGVTPTTPYEVMTPVIPAGAGAPAG